MLQRAARNAYSWWWASHIRTKQSKWLDQNLQDMEEKIEYILKIINEEGDSFAVRAEMYYKKRPELVNFVEDCFRGYRALAERYDHLSKDLQSANRTIAAVYPERVQLSMDEEDEESFLAASASSQETNVGRLTALPAVPDVSIPKFQNHPKKKSKMPSRLMSKKGLIKIGGDGEMAVTKSSGLSKTEALEEIDKLQKGILALQTEKEFTKSSYEKGLAKCWEIENRITEMQAQVSSLEDEFGIGTVIEDDEARTLMAATALKSCRDTLAKLQEKQEQTNEEARIEYQRFHEAREKFESMKDQHQSSPTYKEQISGESKFESRNSELKELNEQAESLEQEMARVNEHLPLGAAPVTISELAEKIDELVDKVINLDMEVTSQTSLVMVLRSETNELHSHLRSHEKDGDMLIEGSGSKNEMRELEVELRRVQSLNRNVRDRNLSLQTHFLEASSNIDQLSEDLLNVKPDEDVQSTDFFEEDRAGPGENIFQVKTAAEMKNDEIMNHGDILKVKKNYLQSRQRNFFDVVVEVGQLKAAPKDNIERLFNENQEIISPGYDSALMISREEGMEAEATRDAIHDRNFSVKAEEDNVVKPYISTHGETHLKKGLVNNVLEYSPAKARDGKSLVKSSPLNHIDNLHLQSQMSPLDCDSSSMISMNTKVVELAKKDGILNRYSPVKAEEDSSIDNFSNRRYSKAQEGDSFVPSSPFNHLDNHSLQSQMRSLGCGSESIIAKDVTMEDEAWKDDNLGQICYVKAEKGNIVRPYQSIPHEDTLKYLLTKDASEDNPEQGFKTREDLDFDQNSMISNDRRMEAEPKKDDVLSRNRLVKADKDNTVEPYRSIQQEDLSKKGIVKVLLEDKPDRRLRRPEHTMAFDCDYSSMISKDGRMEAELNKDDILSCNPFLKVEEDSNVKPNQSIQDEDLSKKRLVTDVLQDKGGIWLKENEESKLKEINDEGIDAPENGLVISNHCQSSSSNTGTERSNPGNPFDDHYGMMAPENDSKMGQEKDYYFPDFAPTKQEASILIDYPSEDVRVDQLSEKVQEVKRREKEDSSELLKKVNKDAKELETNEDDQPNWRHLFMYGLEDREKMLLEEYTATLRNYKQVKKKLSETENRNRASLFKTAVQIKVLQSSNASKDAQIQSLYQKLNLFQTNIDETPDLSDEQRAESLEGKEEVEGEITEISIDDAHIVTSIEERIRMDIDDLLEENIDFWMRFSSSIYQIQKFQTSFYDLETELKQLMENKKQDGSTKQQEQSNIRPIFKHLRETLTELTLWWGNNEVLKDDLEQRLAALSNIQEEISRLSNAGENEDGAELTAYQAARFQGEVENMKQGSKKAAEELIVGADRMKRLQVDIEKTLAKLEKELGKTPERKSSASRSKIPLKSFLFGVKLKKQKPSSFFACMSPALQKQYSDLSALPP